MTWTNLTDLAPPPRPNATADDQQQAAVRAVLRRVDTGQLTAGEAWTVLAALGLVDYPGAGKGKR